jgi:hypothetical protein
LLGWHWDYQNAEVAQCPAVSHVYKHPVVEITDPWLLRGRWYAVAVGPDASTAGDELFLKISTDHPSLS